MTDKKDILFVVPDGVGIRNYLYSSLITHLKPKANFHFWTPLPKKAVVEVEDLHSVKIGYTKITLPIESPATRLYREAATYGRILHNAKLLDNPTILNNWKKKKPNLKLKGLYFLAEKMGRHASKKYDRILTLEEKSLKHWDAKIIAHYKEKLTNLNPSVVFITHQRVAFLNPICLAAKELGIRVVCTIYSWDNTPKASLAIKANQYLVWSEYMKQELMLLYPEIAPESITVTGTPQFEFYTETKRIETRTDFAEAHQLDPQKKWICFSGDDIKTSPYDPQYLEDVAMALQQIPEPERPHIIFRRCPVDVSNRYDSVLEAYRDIISPMAPLWNTDVKSWGAVYPKLEDIDVLVNIAYHCELVINVGSTMAHDFAVFNKPGFYLHYDQPISEGWSTETIYNYQHFRSMGDLDAVGWLHSKEELTDKILMAIQDPKTVAIDRKKWMEVIVHHPIENNAQLIANSLLND